MPLYTFKSKSKYQDFFFEMNKAPSIGATIEIEGKQWTRVATLPNAEIDSKINPNSVQDWTKKTHKNDTVGSALDRAKDLSETRKQKNGGVDPIQTQWFDKYAEKRHGQQHPLDKRPRSVSKKVRGNNSQTK